MFMVNHWEGLQYAPEHWGTETWDLGGRGGGVNWRAVIGYGPLIIEFADIMTNGVVLALAGACDFYKASWTESLLLNHTCRFLYLCCFFFSAEEPTCNMAEVKIK